MLPLGQLQNHRCQVICLENYFKCLRDHANLEEQHQQSPFLLRYVPSRASAPHIADLIDDSF